MPLRGSAGVLPRQPPFPRIRVLARKTIFPRGTRDRERGLGQPFLPLPIPPHRRCVMMQTRRSPRSDGVLARDRGGGLNSGNRRKSRGDDDCRDDDGGDGGWAGATRTGGGVGGRRRRPGLRQRRPGRLKRSLQQRAVELGLSGARSCSRRPRREISIETVTNTDTGVRTRPAVLSQLGALSRHRLPRRAHSQFPLAPSRFSLCLCVA